MKNEMNIYTHRNETIAAEFTHAKKQNNQMNYTEFLERKRKKHTDSGFTPEFTQWGWLYPFQQFCVSMALKKGRYALFEDCGLGKTRQQLTWASEVVKYTGKPVLILAPLAVVGQTIEEANKIGIDCFDIETLPDFIDGGRVKRNIPNHIEYIFISKYEQLDNSTLK